MPNYNGNETKYATMALSGESPPYHNCGSWVTTFEHEFANKVGAKYCIACNSGTATLHAALEAVGIREGRKVAIPAFGPIMNTTSTIHANGIPEFIDVDTKSFNMNPRELEKTINGKTFAIMPVDLYGLPHDCDEIMDIARANAIPVIDDAAQCITPSLTADVTSFSFETTKHLTCGEGGAIVTDNKRLAERIRKIAGHGYEHLTADGGATKIVNRHPSNTRHANFVGWNYRMPEVCAAIMMAQLERFDEILKYRRESAKIFLEVIEKFDFMTPQETNPKHAYYTTAVLYDGNLTWKWFYDEFIRLGGEGIYAAWQVPYMEPLIKNQQYKYRGKQYKDLKYNAKQSPVAESIQSRMMQFKTNYTDMERAKEQAEILKDVLRRCKKLL